MKVNIKTWGCSASQSDSEIMAGLLREAGHDIVSSVNEADAIVATTCSVKGRVETEELRTFKEWKSAGKKILVTGCLVQEAHLGELSDYNLLGINDQDNIAEIIEQIGKGGKVVQISENKRIEKANLPHVRKNLVVDVIQCLQGCLSACTFCSTKLVKGNTFSYSEERILSQVKSALADGCKEIWLTSQDNGTYGIDRKTNIANLLNKITSIKGSFFVRNGMSNPQWVLRYLRQMIEAYKDPKIFKFLHIPVQAGSDKVLRDMRRGYTVEQFKTVVSAFRSEIPDLTISTDVICGFPGENDGDFAQTLDLIKWLQPDVINISMYWPRPGTSAAKLPQVPGGIKKNRSGRLSRLYDEISVKKNKKWIGWSGPVLVDEIGTKGGFVSRNYAYKPIVIRKGNLKLGDFVNVKVIDATPRYLIGKLD